ncbi:MAG: TlpA family protein disulfide reductase [Acidobacteriota bacterium]|nr:MAG: TlpA family protein disulfide reductase [Acidobacteriota bacterium]
MRNLFPILVLLAVCSVIPAIGQNRINVGAEAPGFSATDINGNALELNDLRGSVVVITFWSTRCEICRHEFPHLNKLIDEYRGKNVNFLSPSMEQEDRIKAFLRSNRIASRVLPNSFGLVMQYADNDGKGRIEMGFPSYFVIGTDGRVRFRGSGWNKIEQLRSAIDRDLAK